MSIKCTCGRTGEHCPNAGCGSINKHPLIQRTLMASAQMDQDVRYYRCRKCGCEYAFFKGVLFDMECFAPKTKRLVASKEPEDFVKDLNELVQKLQSFGGVIDFPNGIKGFENESPVVEKQAITEIVSKVEKKEEPLPEGWSRNEQGQLVSPLTLDDLFKRKDIPDENNSQG